MRARPSVALAPLALIGLWAAGCFGGGTDSPPPGFDLGPSSERDVQPAEDVSTGSQCTDDSERRCGTDEGPCRSGIQRCSAGRWGACVGERAPGDELCDGEDNDCDGATDELPVDKGLGEPCGSAEGACRPGLLRCGQGALFCDGALQPVEERCDGEDNDCDGATDEGATDASLGELCGLELGACRRGVWRCDRGEVVCADAVTPSDELCDGVDNDCDGATDEDPGDPELGTPCGVSAGECRLGRWTCREGARRCVGGVEPAEETCDGADNDCDGATDEELPGAEVGQVCGSDEGQCRAGRTECLAGRIECVGALSAELEICDGVDNDCDGATDEEPPGAGKPCGSDEGGCQAGTTLCVAGSLICSGAVGPDPERCDGVDNDCNGQVDDQPVDPEIGVACGSAQGECTQGVISCIEGVRLCYGDGGPAEERCDGVDNDCDGLVDEGSLDAGLACGSDRGQCASGVSVCRDGALSCFGALPPRPELCDGLDNDCDGRTDEDDPEGGLPCGSQVGECRAGLTSCSEGALLCLGGLDPVDETCNGSDDDCDGEIDEGAPGAGQPCGVDEGECSSGVTECRGGRLRCPGERPASVEVCDGLDNDCDGETDEDPSDPGLEQGCGSEVGECGAGVLRCVGGGLACEGSTLPVAEICDGLDQDCDGRADNGADEACEAERGPGFVCLAGLCTSSCAPDLWEPNNLLAASAVLPSQGRLSATVCAWDEDYYLLPGCPAGARLWALVATDRAPGAALGVQLLGVGGEALEGGSGSGATVSLLLPLPAGEDVTLRVFPVFDGQSSYELSWDALCLQDDDFEDNDSLDADAAPLEVGVYSELVLLPDDEDWYRLDVPDECAFGTLEAQIAFTHSPHGDLDLELTASDGSRLAASSGTGDVEGVALAQASPGAYWLRVHGFKQAGNRYRLSVSLSCPRPGDDPLEENDTPSQAAPLVPGEYGPLVALDDDWYVVGVECPGATLTASASFTHAAGDLDLQVLDRATPPRVLAASTTLSDDERAVAAELPAGEVAVRVYGFRGASNSYGLTLEIECPPPPDDAFEDNDQLEQASDLGAGGLFPELVLVAGDEDWYRISVDPACGAATLECELNFDAGEGDIDIALHAVDGRSLGSSAGGGDSERLVARELGVGQYYLRVHCGDETSLPYSLRVVRSCRAPGDDAFEENDTLAQATPMPTGRWDELVSLDDDWYRLDVGCVAAVVEAGIVFDHEVGDLDLWIGDGQGRTVAQSVGVGDEEVVVARDRPAGAYLVRVYGYAQADNVYSLWLTVSCPQEADDLREENDTPAQAAALDPGEVRGLVRLPDDDDWYRFDLGPGCGPATVELELASEREVPQLALTLLAPAGEHLARLDGAGVAVARGLPDGSYLAVVHGSGLLPSPYGLRLVKSCLRPDDDPLEENDTPAQALALAPGHFDELALLPGDEDWYRLEVPPGCEAAVLEADIFFEHAQGDLDLALLDGELRSVRSAQSLDDDERLVASDLTPGGYLLQVAGWGDAGASYELFWALSCHDPDDDELEENDTWLQSRSLDLGLRAGLVLTPGDADWFALPAPCAGADVWAELDAALPVELLIVDSGGLARPPVEHPALTNLALAADLAALPWYVVVRPPPDLAVPLSYALDVGVGCPAPAVLNEVRLPGADGGRAEVFVEIWAPPGTELGGWRLQITDATGALPVTDILLTSCGAGGGCLAPDDGLLVVAHPDAVDPDADPSALAEQADLFVEELAALPTSAGSLVLQRPLEVGWQTVDALGYGVFEEPQRFRGEGRPAWTPAAGESIGRRPGRYDTDDNLRDFASHRPPDPGQP